MRDHGGVALEPTGNELLARAKVVNPTTGLRLIGCPHHISFNIALRDGAGGELGPLGMELAQVVMQAGVDQNESKHAKAQEARNKALEAQPPSPPRAARRRRRQTRRKLRRQQKPRQARWWPRRPRRTLRKKAGEDAKAAVSSPGRERGPARGRGRQSAAAEKNDGEAEEEDDFKPRILARVCSLAAKLSAE